MTVNDFWSYALKVSKAVEPVIFSSLNGKTVGVDVSVWMRRLCATDAVALCMSLMSCRPRYMPPIAISLLQTWHYSLVSEGITPYYVFDGQMHPMKSVAHKKRDKKRKISRAQLF
jgi:hypothetical protein